MSLWSLLTGSSSSDDDNEVRRFTVEHPGGYEYELVAGQEDATAIVADSDRTIVNDQPYDQPRGFWGRLFG